MSTNFVAALPRLMAKRARLATMALVLAFVPALPAAATLPTQSWNGYHWSRTGPLAIQIGNNLDATWSPYYNNATSQWNAANNIDFVAVAGSAPTSTCDPVYGTVQVCNGNYGANGWLGYATVYTSGTIVVEATVKLNDYYFGMARYNTTAWRAMTMCQEIGHTLGLAHADTIRTDINKGTCMDYTNDPTGLINKGNGTLANIAPSASDFSALNGIYATLDATQLAQTTPGYTGAPQHIIVGAVQTEALGTVPEPAIWALMLGGFGLIGKALRCRRNIAVAA